jgi:hypothetical protein
MEEEAGRTSSELQQLAISLQDPFFRKAFVADPLHALAQEEIRQEGIPEDVLEALVELSPQELAALARIRKALEAAHVPKDVIVRMV